eukprot:scaffold7232_cov63-Cyclotella_meneghiniana.AAC.10
MMMCAAAALAEAAYEVLRDRDMRSCWLLRKAIRTPLRIGKKSADMAYSDQELHETGKQNLKNYAS